MGTHLVSVDKEAVIKQVNEVLPHFPQVAAAYFFGSALGLCRPDSDIDLGLVLEEGIDPESAVGARLEGEVVMALRPIEGHPFSVVLLNPCQPIFTFRVIKSGELIYVRNFERLTDVIEFVSRRYADLYPRYERALKEVLEEFRSAG